MPNGAAFLSDWPSLDINRCDAIQLAESNMADIHAGRIDAAIAAAWRMDMIEAWAQGLTLVAQRYLTLYGNWHW